MLLVQLDFVSLVYPSWNGRGLAPKSFFLGQASWRRRHVKWVLKDERRFAKPDCTKAKDLVH